MESAEENAYEILGLPQGPAATDVEIKKAYRKLALIKHPDKNPNNPNAASEFAALQRAYDLLTDEEGRKALDDFLKARAARAERTVIHDKKRARFAEELRKREHAAESLSEEAKAKARLQAEIARMRQAAVEKEAKQLAARQANTTAGGGDDVEIEKEQDDTTTAAEVADALPRTLKVSWTRPGIEYSSADLRRIFSVHGEVEDVVLREAKKRKGSALVVMATREAAEKAGKSVHGELSNPLLVIPLTKGSSGQTNDTKPASVPAFTTSTLPTETREPKTTSSRPTLGPRPTAPLFPAGAKPSAATGGGTSSSRATMPQFASFTSFQRSSNAPTAAAAARENPVDDAAAVRRRHAEERQRLIAQLQEEEDGDE